MRISITTFLLILLCCTIQYCYTSVETKKINTSNHAMANDMNVDISRLSTAGKEFFNNATKFYKTLLQQIYNDTIIEPNFSIQEHSAMVSFKIVIFSF